MTVKSLIKDRNKDIYKSRQKDSQNVIVSSQILNQQYASMVQSQRVDQVQALSQNFKSKSNSPQIKEEHYRSNRAALEESKVVNGKESSQDRQAKLRSQAALIKLEDLQKLRTLIEQLELVKLEQERGQDEYYLKGNGKEKGKKGSCQILKADQTAVESTNFIDGGSSKTEDGGATSRNQIPQKQSTQPTQSIQHTQQSAFFSSMEEVQAPIDINKRLNLLSQLHHQLGNVDQLNHLYQIKPELFYNFDSLILSKPLKLEAPQYIKPCPAIDTSLASSKYVESINSENDSSNKSVPDGNIPNQNRLTQNRASNEGIQTGFNFIKLQNCSKIFEFKKDSTTSSHLQALKDYDEGSLLKALFQQQSPIKSNAVNLDDSGAFNAFLASINLRPASEMHFQPQVSHRPGMRSQCSGGNQSNHQKSYSFSPPKPKRDAKFLIENDHKSNSVKSEDSISEPSQKILSIRQTDHPEIDEELLKCQSRLGSNRSIQDNDVSHKDKNQRILNSAQLPLSLQSYKSRQQKSPNQRLAQTDHINYLRMDQRDDFEVSDFNQHANLRGRTEDGPSNNTKTTSDHSKETHMKNLLQTIVLQQSLPYNYDNNTQSQGSSMQVTSRQDMLKSSRKIEDQSINKVKELMKLELQALEQESQSTMKVENEQKIKEGSTKNINKLISLNPDEEDEFIISIHRNPRLNSNMLLMNSGVSRSPEGRFTSHIKLQEVNQGIPLYSQNSQGSLMANQQLNRRSQPSLNHQDYLKFSLGQKEGNIRTLVYDGGSHARDYRAQSSDQVTVFDINHSNSNMSEIYHQHNIPHRSNFMLNNNGLSLDHAPRYYLQDENYPMDEMYCSSHSLSSRLQTIQELQNQEDSSKSPSSNSIMFTNKAFQGLANILQQNGQDDSDIMKVNYSSQNRSKGHISFQCQPVESIPDELQKAKISNFPYYEEENNSSNQNSILQYQKTPLELFKQRYSGYNDHSQYQQKSMGNGKESLDMNSIDAFNQLQHISMNNSPPKNTEDQPQHTAHFELGTVKRIQTCGTEDSPKKELSPQPYQLMTKSSAPRAGSQKDEDFDQGIQGNCEMIQLSEGNNVNEDSNNQSQVIVNLNFNLKQMIATIDSTKSEQKRMTSRSPNSNQLCLQSQTTSSVAIVNAGQLSFKGHLSRAGSGERNNEEFSNQSPKGADDQNNHQFFIGTQNDGLAFSFKRQYQVGKPEHLSQTSPGSLKKNKVLKESSLTKIKLAERPGVSSVAYQSFAEVKKQPVKMSASKVQSHKKASSLSKSPQRVIQRPQTASQGTLFTKRDPVQSRNDHSQKDINKSKEKVVGTKVKKASVLIDLSRASRQPLRNIQQQSRGISPSSELKSNCLNTESSQNFDSSKQDQRSFDKLSVSGRNLPSRTKRTSQMKGEQSSEKIQILKKEQLHSPEQRSLTGLTARQLEKTKQQKHVIAFGRTSTARNDVLQRKRSSVNPSSSSNSSVRPSSSIPYSQRDLHTHALSSPVLSPKVSHREKSITFDKTILNSQRDSSRSSSKQNKRLSMVTHHDIQVEKMKDIERLQQFMQPLSSQRGTTTLAMRTAGKRI